jgi:hypothetical protein
VADANQGQASRLPDRTSTADAGHEQQSASIEEIQAKSENNIAHYARQMLSRISHSQSECNPLGFTKSLTVNDVLKSDLQLVGRENDQQKGVSLTSSNRDNRTSFVLFDPGN